MYNFPGNRPPQSQRLERRGQLPAHLGPEKDQCVIVPVTRVYRCSEFGREEVVIPGQIRCSCGGDHDDNPCAVEAEMNEWAEEIPGWTAQSERGAV